MAKYLKEFSTTAEYESYINNSPTLPNVSLTLDDNVVHYNKKPDYSKDYLTFEALESGTFTLTVPAAVDSTYMTSVSYSTDGGTTWTDTTIDNTAQTITTPTINAGSKVLWKGIGNAMYTSSFSSTGNFNVSGNIMSMLYGDNFIGQTSFASGSESNFPNLFSGYAKLISAANLVLPATTLTRNCYGGMFQGCTSLTTAPSILPATTLANLCYSDMFKGCWRLTTVPELPATTLANYCYENMFMNCTSLTTAPELTATTLADYCYQRMFYGCTSLTTAPSILPATTLAYYCYNQMFKGCTSLTTAPELPATTLANDCYIEMFSGCTSLTTAPELPATTLASFCYTLMFNGCTNLNNIKMLATNISARDCLNKWVQNVAVTGTFIKASSATLPTGDSGIPSGWTVVDA